ncbi:putative leader peptide [Streptomyces koyangensis]|uniref:putative leader peptide n=1 Tax=Streptomyces koyangensis TaxID=188770 RepID=UPI0035BC6F85
MAGAACWIISSPFPVRGVEGRRNRASAGRDGTLTRGHGRMEGSWAMQPLGDLSVTLVERRHIDLGRLASAICRCS